MYADHEKAIWGLSIANIVISGLGLLGLLGFLVVGLGAAIVADSSDPFDLVTGMAWWGSFLTIAMIAVIPALVAGILGVRNARKPAKLTVVMVWNIVGAAVYVIGVGVLGALVAIPCILVAVFSYQDKKAYTSGLYSGTDGLH